LGGRRAWGGGGEGCVCGVDWWTDLRGIGVVTILRREALTGFLRDEDGCCGVVVEAGLAVEDTFRGLETGSLAGLRVL
jgi:hypothetical protein